MSESGAIAAGLAALRRNLAVGVALAALALFVAFSVYYYGQMSKPGSEFFFGNDFLSFHAAGRLAAEGQPAAAYDRAAHQAMQDAIAREVTGAARAPSFYFGYPPTFLLTVTAFGALPYLSALLLFQGGTLALYLAALRPILPSWPALAIVLAVPVGFVNFFFGQNGFLTAGLAGLALLLLPRRPFLAGLVLGLLTVKPQLGLAYPIALLAAGEGRAIAGAALSALMLAAAATLAFGPEIWPAFLALADAARTDLVTDSLVGFGRIQSLFSLLRYFGAATPVAAAVHAAFALATAGVLALAWRSQASHDSKAALALVAALALSPFCLAYDFTALVPAGAFLLAAAARRGGPHEGLKAALLAGAMLMLPTAVIWPKSGVIFGWPTLLLGLAAALWSVRADLRHRAALPPSCRKDARGTGS